MIDDTSHHISTNIRDTMQIPDGMFYSQTRLERMKEIEKRKEFESKKKAVQSFTKAHSKRMKKK